MTQPLKVVRGQGEEHPRSAVSTSPYSPEAEEALLGAVISNPNQFYAVQKILRTVYPDKPDRAGEAFFIRRNSMVWGAIERCIEEHGDVDYRVLLETLRENKHLDEVGGPAYVTELVSVAPSAAHATMYAEMVKRTAVRRNLLSALDHARLLTLDERLGIGDVATQINDTIAGAVRGVGAEALIGIQEAIARHMDATEAAYVAAVNGATPATVPTGISGLDSLLEGGFYRKRVVIVGGATHQGKTLVMSTIAYNMLMADKRVVYYNLADAGTVEFTNKLVAMQTGIPPNAMIRGALNDRQYTKYVEAAGQMARKQMMVNSEAGTTPKQIRDQCRELQQRWGGLDAIFVDYLQVVGYPPEYDEYKALRIIIESLWKISQELDVPVVVGSQVNRGAAKRRPTKDDLHGSSVIEKTADLTIMLWRPWLVNREFEHPELLELNIDKNRINGRMAKIDAQVHAQVPKLEDWRPKIKTRGAEK